MHGKKPTPIVTVDLNEALYDPSDDESEQKTPILEAQSPHRVLSFSLSAKKTIDLSVRIEKEDESHGVVSYLCRLP